MEKTESRGVKQFLKKIPPLVYVKRKIYAFFHRVNQAINRRHIETIKSLPLYVPSSSGSYKDIATLTTLNANQVFPFLEHLASVAGKDVSAKIVPIHSLCADAASKKCAEELKVSFNKYGSDKSATHDYHLLYGSILKDKSAVTAILEIGLGTNNTDVPSNMGEKGRPGASLRAFRDVLPNASIFGADVDKRILFEEERIKTFYVDQTDLKSFDELGKNLKEEFDLIIDDGLHSANANIATLSFALGKLKRSGVFVVEDISPDALPVWRVVSALLSPEYKSQIVSTANDAYVFLVKKN